MFWRPKRQPAWEHALAVLPSLFRDKIEDKQMWHVHLARDFMGGLRLISRASCA